ncbi:glycosyltransferase [Limosilactobacillus oris]|uniref:glycosyltransferase n=1 Tax=Limosilactobacillus oris TaxID=1632 RepID=UPI0018832B55|nr:glycosyltransferase [Limosilactobacillus oris]MBF0601458.1 glycosyltransferase [Limosilactobacillus oris]
MEQARISLIVLTNGEEAGLSHCLQTCLDQNYSNLELLVVTNNSSIISKVSGERCQVLFQAGTPLDQLRLAGVRKASGKYVMFIEAEDFLASNESIAKLMDELQEKNSDVFFTNFIGLKNGTFVYPYTTIWGELMPFNYLLFIRSYDSFRRLGGNIFDRQKLLELGDDLNNLSLQMLSWQLLKLAEQPYFTAQSQYVWDGTKQIPPFRWSDELHLSDTFALTQANQSLPNSPVHHKSINIVICVDERGADQIRVLLYSIEVNNPGGGTIYLVYEHLSDKQKQALETLGAQFTRFKLQLLPLSATDKYLLKQISLRNAHLPLSTYYRILLPYLLPEVDRVLYLDYDVLVINELTSLYNANLNHHFLGVVRDLGVIVKEDWSKSLFNDSYRDYFNAGVLLMDLAAFRKYGVSWKLHQFIVASTPFFSLEDQDALNLFFKDAVEYLDLDYNYVTRLFLNALPAEERSLEQIKILHFLGSEKPWQEALNYPLQLQLPTQIYRSYRSQLFNTYDSVSPFLSCIIVVESKNEIKRCLETLCYQDCPELEVIVIDASESSEVAQIIQAYQKQFGHLIYQRAESNATLRQMYQMGNKLAKGSYVTLLNALDFMPNNAPLTKVISLLRENQLDFLATMHMFTSNGQVVGYPAPETLVDTTEKSITDLADYQRLEYQNLKGLLVKRQLLSKIFNGSDEIMVQRVLEASRRSALWQGYLWIEG